MKEILIVDDKPENLYLLQAMLESEGYKILAVKNGAEALGLMRNVIPDIIISDILMPIMDGFTLCRECKKDKTLKDIPFFFYTATYTDKKDEEYALCIGADRFILKPQEPDVFIKIINDFLNDVKKKEIKLKKIVQQPETVVLKEYNEVLVRKIEDKMLQTEKAEKELREYANRLELEIAERKQMELDLRESEKNYKELIDGMNETVWVIGFNGDLIDVNNSALVVLGYTKDELLTIGLPGVDASLKKEDIVSLAESMPADELQIFETNHKTKDGRIFPVEIYSSIVSYRGEQAIISIARDISERKKTEKELEKYRNHLEQLVEERTKELEEKNKELEYYNRLFEGREFRIKELREKVRELEKRLREKDK